LKSVDIIRSSCVKLTKKLNLAVSRPWRHVKEVGV